jgi:hypothetical protein
MVSEAPGAQVLQFSGFLHPLYTQSATTSRRGTGPLEFLRLHSHVFTLKVDPHIACRAHAAPLPCRAAKGLECVFPI